MSARSSPRSSPRGRAISTSLVSTCWRAPTWPAATRSSPVPGALDAMAAGVVDAVVQGLSGLEHDIALQVTPPDIDLGDVVCPVLLWYGACDRSAPPAFGHWFAAHLPAATLDVLEGAGHCFVLPRWAEVLVAVAKEA